MRLKLNNCLSALHTAPCCTVSLITEAVVFRVLQTALRLVIHQACEIPSGDSATVMTFTVFSITAPQKKGRFLHVSVRLCCSV